MGNTNPKEKTTPKINPNSSVGSNYRVNETSVSCDPTQHCVDALNYCQSTSSNLPRRSSNQINQTRERPLPSSTIHAAQKSAPLSEKISLPPSNIDRVLTNNLKPNQTPDGITGWRNLKVTTTNYPLSNEPLGNATDLNLRTFQQSSASNLPRSSSNQINPIRERPLPSTIHAAQKSAPLSEKISLPPSNIDRVLTNNLKPNQTPDGITGWRNLKVTTTNYPLSNEPLGNATDLNLRTSQQSSVSKNLIIDEKRTISPSGSKELNTKKCLENQFGVNGNMDPEKRKTNVKTYMNQDPSTHNGQMTSSKEIPKLMDNFINLNLDEANIGGGRQTFGRGRGNYQRGLNKNLNRGNRSQSNMSRNRNLEQTNIGIDHINRNQRGRSVDRRNNEQFNRYQRNENESIQSNQNSNYRRYQNNYRHDNRPNNANTGKHQSVHKTDNNVLDDVPLPERGNGAVPKETNFRNRPVRKFGFKKMESLLSKEPDEIMLELQNIKTQFREFLESDITPDFIVLSLHVFTKMSHSFHVQNLTEVLNTIAASRYMDKLMLFIYNLSDQSEIEKRRNKFFWNDVHAFWHSLTTFCINILNKMPATGQDIVPKVLKAIIQTVPNFEENYQIIIQKDVKDNLENIQLRLAKLSEKKNKTETKSNAEEIEEEPPDDFRDIQIYPLPHELLDEKEVYLRKNKIEGKYRDVDHYLDVQFRLLREDFVRPLRQGIQEYLSTDANKRLSNIKVFKDVKCIKMEKTQSQMGFLIQVFKKEKVKNLERSKRFMFGSLVCFTSDNFKTIIFGKILDRKIEYLREGQVIVGFENHVEFDPDILYTMVECMIYFEPYYQVLKALQNMQTINFPLKRYLVDVESEREFPGYVNEITCFEINKQNVHLFGDWSYLKLNLNESQKKAFKNALSSKFCIVQGPPGTGKTYLGLEIAKTLIYNKHVWNEHPMLVICYTNHALDQFLEGLLSATESIVRVGGQSKNENLDKYNIRNLRRQTRGSVDRSVIFDLRREINSLSSTLQFWNEIYSDLMNCDSVVNPQIFTRIDGNLSSSWFANVDADQFLDWLLQAPLKFKHSTRDHQIIQKSDELDVEIFDESENQNQNTVLDLYDDVLLDETYRPIKLKKIFDLKLVKARMCDLEHHEDFNNEQSELFYELQMEHVKLQERYEYSKYQLDILVELLKNNMVIPIPKNVNYKNPKNMQLEHRWQLYSFWVQNLIRSAIIEIKEHDKKFRTIYSEFTEVCDIVDTKIMEERMVIGMTTTGAARLQSSLQTLKCPIIIVEEAAEVLESHVITSLSENCQHLILIGDHKQLKPSTSDYKLDRDYHLGVSLFERMVRNNMHCDTLNVQHRMRPDIARLVCPNIYKDLKNHESVHAYPPIRGVEKSLYFITHKNPEKESNDSSKENKHEAKYLALLARYLILNGYEPEQITILVAYSGQLFLCMAERRKYDILKSVKICVLDNYQGEENDIILLSLVRNNNDGVVGFLSLENRVCVALSRAKHGLYIMGNIDLLANHTSVWKPIKTELESMDSIGESLPLKCQNHLNCTQIKELTDFHKVSEGGCTEPCNMLLDCNHYCQKICHMISHDIMKCFEDCTRILCDKNHICPKKCYEDCGECNFPEETLFPCGHINFKPCSLNIDDAKCYTPVQTTLPCDHLVEKPCYISPENFCCPHSCESRIEPCGHSCVKKCHHFEDPDHIQYLCKKPCERHNSSCSRPENTDHKCKKACYEECKLCDIIVRKPRTICQHVFDVACHANVDDIICEKPCKRKLACGHDCKLKCNEPCDSYKCKFLMNKQIIECGHYVKFSCHLIPPKTACTSKCERILPCGHKCTLKCKENCFSSKCEVLVKSNIQSPCGHILEVPCHLKNETTISNELLSYCKEKCKKMLDCEHPCTGTCGECSQGRIHKDCGEKCPIIFICGHECTTSCRLECLPCQKPCTYRCNHSKCEKKCGEPCTPCVEPCSRRCEHGVCEAKCFQKCTIEPCSEPCNKSLTCGHLCIGFCGDPCPPLCRICDKDEVTDIFFGTEDDEDARFVYLQDCKHVVESQGLEHYFKLNSGDNDRELTTICCPKCKTQITKIQRYSDLLKESFKDIQMAKKIIYGKFSSNKQYQKRLVEQGENTKTQFSEFLRDSPPSLKWIQSFIEKCKSTNKAHSTISNQELQLFDSKLQIFQGIMTNTGEYKSSGTSSRELFFEQVNYLIKSLSASNSMSKQKIENFENELLRLTRIKELSILGKKIEELKEFKDCYIVARTFKPYSNEEDRLLMKRLNILNNISKSGLRISQEEKFQILKAIGLSPGHWFKCKNGHIYAIGECGGATQQSICPECKETIGGSDHRLDSTNAVATEMDGATMGAYEEQAMLFNQGRWNGAF